MWPLSDMSQWPPPTPSPWGWWAAHSREGLPPNATWPEASMVAAGVGQWAAAPPAPYGGDSRTPPECGRVPTPLAPHPVPAQGLLCAAPSRHAESVGWSRAAMGLVPVLTPAPPTWSVSCPRWGQPPHRAHPAAAAALGGAGPRHLAPAAPSDGLSCGTGCSHTVTVTCVQTWAQGGGERGIGNTAAALDTPGVSVRVASGRTPATRGGARGVPSVTLFPDPLGSLSPQRVSSVAAAPAPGIYRSSQNPPLLPTPFPPPTTNRPAAAPSVTVSAPNPPRCCRSQPSVCLCVPMPGHGAAPWFPWGTCGGSLVLAALGPAGGKGQ